MTDQLIDVKTVAEWLGVTPAWVYREVQLGRLPHVKLSYKQLRFKSSEIEAHITARHRTADGPQPTPRSRKTA